MKYNRINELKDYYEDKLNIYKHGAKAVNWRDKKTQYLRFKKICEIGSFNKKKVLDVGCGLGHLKDFLKISKIKTNYIGIDISEKMILGAKKRSEDKNFYCLDILKISNKDIRKLKSEFVAPRTYVTYEMQREQTFLKAPCMGQVYVYAFRNACWQQLPWFPRPGGCSLYIHACICVQAKNNCCGIQNGKASKESCRRAKSLHGQEPRS